MSMETLIGKHWHHLPTAEVVDLLGADPGRGLDIFEVERRRRHFGPNVLTPPRPKSPLVRFLLQFHSSLVYILLVSAVVTGLLKDWTDAATIFGVVLVNAIIGFFQESKAEKAIQALAETMAAEAVVIRAGRPRKVPAADLVPGDTVVLQSGDKVPADLRLVAARDLQVAEHALTGESLPVLKKAGEGFPHDAPLGDRFNMAYASTLVTYGRGTGLVIATGDRTEVGRISRLISDVQTLDTPLTRKIDRFSRVLLYAILGLAGLTFAAGLLHGRSVIETLMAAIALGVSAIPEGLPAVVTVTLAIGVTRMARRRAIIRRLAAVETLGSVTVICSDKTGTLTQNQMTVRQIFAGGLRYEVTGSGYDPAGGIQAGPGAAMAAEGGPLDPALAETLTCGLLCNDSAVVRSGEGPWTVEGDPTEGALLVAAGKAGLTPEAPWLPRRLDVIPFEAEYQYMATLHDAGPGRPRTIYAKGSVEAVLALCSWTLGHGGAREELRASEIQDEMERLSRLGLRVLAFAKGELGPERSGLEHGDLAGRLSFLGLQGMIDPARPEAVRAVATCQDAGIMVKMITGDHPLTAAAVADQVGLIRPCLQHEAPHVCVLTGRDLAGIADSDLPAAAEDTAVFARVSPEQKLRLVEALQARGHVVAMTGDGVNDAPALKQADVGVAMGVTGTQVAKEAAEMVLTDDNFASIEAAVEEGRGVYDNLVKFIAWTLPTNVGESLIILVAVLAGLALPVLPVQVLWINMATATFLGTTLALEPKERGLMGRLPRDPKQPILTKPLVRRVLLVGLMILAGAFGLFEWELALGASLDRARTVAVAVVVMAEVFYLFNCRSLRASPFRIGFAGNLWALGGAALMIAAQALFTYVPAMNRFFSSAPIGAGSWLRIAAVGVAVFAAVEAEKVLARRGG
jgi:cation-transporting ATPase F